MKVSVGVGYGQCTLTQDSIFIRPTGENINLETSWQEIDLGTGENTVVVFYLNSGRVFPVTQQFQVLVLQKSWYVSRKGPAQGVTKGISTVSRQDTAKTEGCVWPAKCSTGVGADADSHSRPVLWATRLSGTSSVDTIYLCRQTKQKDRDMLERAQANTRPEEHSGQLLPTVDTRIRGRG
jgi:hypothetical protein